MICTVIEGPSKEDIEKQIKSALPFSDLLEWRFDLFHDIGMEALKALRRSFSIPMIMTLRSKRQGGSCQITGEDYLKTIRSLLELNPDYLDLESWLPVEFYREILSAHPKIKLISSYHDFNSFPSDFEALLGSLKLKPAAFYKMALMAENSYHAFKLLNWAKTQDSNLIAISMGPFGKACRILSPSVKSPITYACLNDDKELAPGQCSSKTLVTLYHARTLNPKTKIYGLIGDPIDHSLSHESHNALIKNVGLDAIYVKIPVKSSELASFLSLAKQVPFSGLSVTMPLKEEVMKHLDLIDPEAASIGAVNTLSFEEGKIKGWNTDGVGALAAIEAESSVKGKKIVIIGAGGAAKAIAREACRRGAIVTLLNRDKKRALELAETLNCEGGSLEDMEECFLKGYDCLINTTPVPLPINPNFLLPSAAIMDIKTVPKETQLLQHAKEKGCRTIFGYRMFVEQAIRQFDIWFKGAIPLEVSRKIIEDKVLNLL